MSNQVDHRHTPARRNARRKELPSSFGCGGEGHNGQTGRSKWKKLSRRCERRALKEGRTPRIKKRSSSRSFARPIPSDPIETEY